MEIDQGFNQINWDRPSTKIGKISDKKAEIWEIMTKALQMETDFIVKIKVLKEFICYLNQVI